MEKSASSDHNVYKMEDYPSSSSEKSEGAGSDRKQSTGGRKRSASQGGGDSPQRTPRAKRKSSSDLSAKQRFVQDTKLGDDIHDASEAAEAEADVGVASLPRTGDGATSSFASVPAPSGASNVLLQPAASALTADQLQQFQALESLLQQQQQASFSQAQQHGDRKSAAQSGGTTNNSTSTTAGGGTSSDTGGNVNPEASRLLQTLLQQQQQACTQHLVWQRNNNTNSTTANNVCLEQRLLQELLVGAAAVTGRPATQDSTFIAPAALGAARNGDTTVASSQEIQQALAQLQQQRQVGSAPLNTATTSAMNGAQMLSMLLRLQHQQGNACTAIGTGNSSFPLSQPQQYPALPPLQQNRACSEAQLLLALLLQQQIPAPAPTNPNADINAQVLACLMTGLQQQQQQQASTSQGVADLLLRQQLQNLPFGAPVAPLPAPDTSNNAFRSNILGMLQQGGSSSLMQQPQQVHPQQQPQPVQQQQQAANNAASLNAFLQIAIAATASLPASRVSEDSTFASAVSNNSVANINSIQPNPKIERKVGHAVAYLPANMPAVPEKLDMQLPSDAVFLSEYQSQIRKNLEFFTSTRDDVNYSVQGRKKKAILGQVGIRCRHCSDLSLRQRGRGAVYYPTTLNAVYQAAQNMATNHLQEHCNRIPTAVRRELGRLRDLRETASGGKQYWADACRAVGLVEDGECLRFAKHGTSSASEQQQQQQQQQPQQQAHV